MAVTICGSFRVTNIRQSDKVNAVNFKASAPIGRKNTEGKKEYVNIDCTLWGVQGEKVFLPYVKEGDYITLTLDWEALSIWEASGKTGINIKATVLTITLLNQSAVAVEVSASADDLTEATNTTAPNVSAEATKDGIPF
jgi:hypothetical protein